jgi:hypothetical protein
MRPTAANIATIAQRMRQLFASFRVAPAIDEGDGRFSAELDGSSATIDAGPFIVDRSRTGPRTLPSAVVRPRGFRIEISMMPMLPQIMTQYAAPPTPGGGLRQSFPKSSPDGEHLSTKTWFTPDARGSGPFLVVEVEIGRDLGQHFVDAVLAQIY